MLLKVLECRHCLVALLYLDMFLTALKDVAQKARQCAALSLSRLIFRVFVELFEELLSSLAIQMLNSCFSYQLKVVCRVHFAVVAIYAFRLFGAPTEKSALVSIYKDILVIKLKII